MEAGTILMSRGKGATSNLIAWGTCSRFSHIAIVVRIDRCDIAVKIPSRHWRPHRQLIDQWEDGMYVVESTSLSPKPCEILRHHIAGVQVHKPIDLPFTGSHYWQMRLHHPLSDMESRRLTEACLNRVGIPYDFAGAGLAGAALINKFLPCAYDHRRYFCCEFVGEAILLGLEGRKMAELKAGTLPPGKIAKALQCHGLYHKPKRVKLDEDNPTIVECRQER